MYEWEKVLHLTCMHRLLTSCISTGVVGRKLINCNFSALVSLNSFTACRKPCITSAFWFLHAVFSRYFMVWKIIHHKFLPTSYIIGIYCLYTISEKFWNLSRFTDTEFNKGFEISNNFFSYVISSYLFTYSYCIT